MDKRGAQQLPRFTTDNTFDFSADELATLNAAYCAIIADAMPQDDFERVQGEKHVSDTLLNAWVAGMGVDELIAAAQRLGV